MTFGVGATVSLVSAGPPINLALLAEIHAGDVRILWINDWYEGPIEAVVEYLGVWHLMVVHDLAVIATDLPWRWVLYRLSSEQCEEEARWHRLFIEHVGAHWDCTGELHPAPSGQLDLFYGPYNARPPRDVGRLASIGWLRSMPAPKSPG